jgi:dipeptidyl aminopeptidase/acylaminoacyl peptidase
MKRFVVLLPILFLSLCPFVAAQNRTYTIEALLRVRRVGDPQVSPDGKRVAFTIGDVNYEANRVVTQIYTTSLEGGSIKQLTSGDRSSSSPRWSPDGKKIAFTTGSQVWVMNSDGDNKEQVTKISTGAAAPVWSPDGKWIAFTSDVYPDCDKDECNKQRDEQAESSKVKAHIVTRLLYKHWDEWRDVKRTHVFVVSSKGGTARDRSDYRRLRFAAVRSRVGCRLRLLAGLIRNRIPAQSGQSRSDLNQQRHLRDAARGWTGEEHHDS